MRIVIMDSRNLEAVLDGIKKSTDEQIKSLGKLSELDCEEMNFSEKRAYLRGFDRANEKDLDKPIDELC